MELKVRSSCIDDPEVLIPCSFEIPSGDGKRIPIIFNPSNAGVESTNENLSGIHSATQKPKPFIINCPQFKCRVNLIDTPGIGDTR